MSGTSLEGSSSSHRVQQIVDESKPLWNHVECFERPGGASGGNAKSKCRYCGTIINGSCSRVKAHLLKISGYGIKPCPKMATPGSSSQHGQSSQGSILRDQQVGSEADPQVEEQHAEDAEAEEEDSRGTKRKLTSPVWNEFTRLKKKDAWKAKCIWCSKYLSPETKNGTKHRYEHLKVCIYQKRQGKVQTSLSSFQRHVSHIITNEEVNALMKQNYKFNWEMPAEDIPKSKWVGTGEKLQGVYGDILDVKGKLRDHWQNTLTDQLNSRLKFFSLCNSYRDIMHCNKKPFYLKGSTVDSSTMDAYLMHTLNHVHRTRDVIIKNDAKLRNAPNEDILDDNSYLDQGFTRPKVLFLLPLKSIARRIVKRLIQLSPLTQKDNAMGQFKEKFGESDDELEEPEHSSKPTDFDLLFVGDTEDHFVFGIKYTKKSVKLYSNFYSSDIIIASPLALKLKIDEAEHVKEKERVKEKDFDFLSSIEIVVVDHADVISMQNWSHLHAVFEQLNHLPSKEHGTNVMRIRPWYLDQHARYYRQTIFLSSYLTPEMNALFNRLCLNYEGKVKLMTEYSGVLPKIQLEVRQVYEKFDASSIAEADDARFDYFCKKVYPKIHESDEGGVLLFVSSYFEYIRISNFLKSQEASFCRVGEATSQLDISRSRLWFFEGKKKILLYSERSHFFHRYKIRGTQHLVIYSLPGRKEFYPELVNMLGESMNRKCNVLFSRLDILKLERIVGASAARRLISSDKSMFVFS